MTLSDLTPEQYDQLLNAVVYFICVCGAYKLLRLVFF